MSIIPPEKTARVLTTLTPIDLKLSTFTVVMTYDESPDYRDLVRFAYEDGKEYSVSIPAALNQANEHFMKLRGRAVDYISDVEERLDKLIVDYFAANADQMGTIVNIYHIPDASAASIARLNFMACKDILSEILKNDARLGGKRGYTKLINDLVLERNKYAHGRFYFGTNNTPLLQWQNSKGHVHYGKVDDSLISLFTNACLEVFIWLDYIEEKFTGAVVNRVVIKRTFNDNPTDDQGGAPN